MKIVQLADGACYRFVGEAGHLGTALIATLALFMLLAQPRPAGAAEPKELLTGYSLTSWHDSDGRPLGSVYAIAQDGQGFLWVGSDAGLFRFDGWQLRAWDTLSDERLPGSAVTAIRFARDGSMWVGFSGARVHQIRMDRSQLMVAATDGPMSARDLAEDGAGVIWAISDGSLYSRHGSEWVQVEIPTIPHFTVPLRSMPWPSALLLSVSRRGDLWVGTRWGVWKRDVHSGRFALQSQRFVWGISEDAAGDMWTSDVVSGFRKLDASDLPPHALQGTGYRLLHDRRGNLWVGTFGSGLWLVKTDPQTHTYSVQRAGDRTGLSTDAVNALLEDKDGNMWVGTAAGLHRLSPRLLTPVEGLRDVISLEAGQGNSLWAGTPSGLLRLTSPQELEQPQRLLPGKDVRSLFDDQHGTVWIGTTTGLWRLSAGRLEPITLPSLSGVSIVSVSPAVGGGLWLGDGGWLYHWDGQRVVPLQTADEDSFSRLGRVLAAQLDARQNLWVSFAKGSLGLVEPDRQFRIVDVVSDGTKGRTKAVTTAHELNDEMWFGGIGELTRFKNGRFDTIGIAQGLPASVITTILDDRQGYLWLSVDRGLLRTHHSELEKAISDKAYRIRYRLYDPLDGLAGAPIGLYGSARTGDGTLWFIRSGGLTSIDSTALAARDVSAPAVRIESVLAEDRRFPADGQLVFAPGTKRLQIDYTALALTASNKIRFRYMLDGIDAAWIDAGTRRAALYTNLPPGDYRFRVEAMVADGGWDSTSTSWNFAIRPAYYETRWFYALSVCAFGLILWLAWQFRIRLVKRQFALALAERARLSRELHDTLLQSLVGVTLQLGAISSAVGSDSTSVIQNRLNRIRRHVETYIDEAQQVIRDLRSVVLDRQDLATALERYGRRLAEESDFEFEFRNISGNEMCSEKEQAQVLRIGMEALTNAARHANAEHVILEIANDDIFFIVRVSDDGDGFDIASVGAKSDKHFGLLTMRERAEEISARLEISSTVGAGTTIEVAVPLHRAVLAMTSQ
jgi:signal transduction histidine kinase/ligand-binding sensor domain-containing protein